MSRQTKDAVAEAIVTNAPMENTPTPEIVKQTAEATAVQVPSAPVPEDQDVAQTLVEIPAAYADYKELPVVVTAPLGLNLRAGPGPGYGVRKVLSDGAPVTVLPLPYGVEVKGWAMVVSEAGTYGWVRTEFLAEPSAGE